jgi:hypothetical protein
VAAVMTATMAEHTADTNSLTQLSLIKDSISLFCRLSFGSFSLFILAMSIQRFRCDMNAASGLSEL